MSLATTRSLAATPTRRPARLLHSLGMLISLVLLIPAVWIAAVVAMTLVWDQGWLRFRATRLAQWMGARLEACSQRLATHLLKDQRNAPYLYTLFGVGTLMPVIFLLALFGQPRLSPGFFWLMAYGYHVVMMGPYMRFFAHTATLIHKEGHEPRGLFKPRYAIFNHIFEYFLGMFYGHVPETYPMGHLRIHHKYDNGVGDVTSTLLLDRTRPSEWLVYLRQFALYWSGISIVTHFFHRGKLELAWRMLRGMLIYYGIIAAFLVYNLSFGFAFLVLPLLSAILYLAAINYTWHAFADPLDPENAYVASVTILNGQYNVFHEDFHVAHHLSPQMHWTEAEQHYTQNLALYRQHMATIFQDTQTFELFLWIILRRYDLLADHFVDLTGTLSHEEKLALLKRRMQPTLQQPPAAQADEPV